MSERWRNRVGFLSWSLSWWRRYAAYGVDAVLWALFVGLLAVEVSGLRDTSLALIETAGAALLLGVSFALRRRLPFTALALACFPPLVQTVAASAGVFGAPALTYVLPCPVLAFLVGRRCERTAPLVTLVSTVALVMLLFNAVSWVRAGDLQEALRGVPDWGTGLLVLVGAVVAPWLLGRYWQRYDHLRTAGWEIAERMETARDLDAERARLRERARIASEMHGALGNDLALLGVRAAALEMTAGDDGSREAASELRSAAHEANLRLREIIGVLRAEAGDASAPEGAGRAEAPEHGGGRSDEEVAAAVERAVGAGMRVRLVREGPDPDPAGPSGRAVHRVVQEALTNAARHAPGSRVTVRLRRETGGQGGTEVRVSDTGGVSGGHPGGSAGNGSGLAELRAVVETAGGTLSADRNEEGGFTLAARIPDGAAAPQAVGPGDPPASVVGAQAATETASLMRRARRGARRRLVVAVVVPTVLAAAVTGLGFGALWIVGVNKVLPQSEYERMRVGDDRASVEPVLPPFRHRPQRPVGGPPAPAGAECRYYLVVYEKALPPLYRLCFADGRLVAKDVVEREE